MNEELWFWIGRFILYFVGIFGGMVVLVFLYFFARELLHPSINRGTATCSTPDDDIQLTSEIGRSATELAEHRAAKEPGK
jgi:hypothetical protein